MNQVIFNIVDRAIKKIRHQELKLAKAIACNNIALVKKLLQQGANPNAAIAQNPPQKSSSPLIFTTFEKSYFTVPHTNNSDRSLTLHHVTAKQECLHLLLEYGADPNVLDLSRRTPLEIAIIWCMPDVVKLLLIYGADPNFKNSQGITPLMRTSILGIQDARPINDKLKMMMHLIDAGAKIDAQAADGKTALMYAVGNSRLEIVEFLVSSGASLSIQDNEGNKACDIINCGVTSQHHTQLQRILTQPQLNILKYKYQEFIPEGDRLLNFIL